jgi:vacuolar-type H+-ATPase subunit H
MADAAEQKARREVRRAQSDFEREQKQLQESRTKSREKRRERFARAQRAGLSLRDIGKEIGVHWTRVGEILREK